MDPATIAFATAAGTAAAAYLDGRFHIRKDLRTLYGLKWAEKQAAKAAAEKRQSLFYIFENTVKSAPPGSRAIWSRTGIYTFAEAYDRVLQYAVWLQSLGLRPKDAVGLYAPNSPEFVFIVLAAWALGCFPAMINYNLADASLVHCVKVSGAKILLVDAEDAGCLQRVECSQQELQSSYGVSVVYMTPSVKQQITTLAPERPPDTCRDHVEGRWPFALIYTSGTTGMPKAFPIANAGIYANASTAPWRLERVISKTDPADRDVWYDCMPLYHGTGAVTGLVTLLIGNTLAIGSKFSARNFWPDIHDSGATVFVYVGETARYLLAQPPGPLDRGHKLRLMYGNGLRPDVWERFQTRFGVPEIFEFFTSTEGVFSLAVWSRSGFGAKSVGHHGALLRWLLRKAYVPVALDPATNDMWRDPQTGFARRVPYEQGGEIIVKLESKQMWPGYYRDAQATNKKFVTDVFEKGDVYYRPGDALRRDSDGLWYFMDRLGDTFRWKGENVATAEVQEVMGTFPCLGEANVYGVEVPGSDGRAGCAAVVLEKASKESFDWRGLVSFLRAKLPRYAVPVFVRVVEGEAEAMGTHNNKQNKVLLRQEGADPSLFGSKVPNGSNDKLYWLPPNGDAYVPFGQGDWDGIVAGKSKL